MFFGDYNHNIDDKGRISIPARFRDDLGEKFYVTKGLDGCLFVFSNSEWQLFQEKLKVLPITNSDARSFVRFFYAGAMECSIDKQGRINLNQNLRDHANLLKEASIIGVGPRIEIWSRKSWETYNDPSNMDSDNIAERMAGLGI